MPSQVITSVENNFTKGLITEFTGLNFPENAATDTDNCEYTIVGDVLRRRGINTEANASTLLADRTNVAINSYKWNNVGGDGSTQIVVEQIGNVLFFYRSSSATIASPLSTQLLPSTVNITTFIPVNGTFDATLECQFSDGNGYLFVCHPSCDPFYCTYVAGVITGNSIAIQIRDFAGIEDGLTPGTRPSTLSPEHTYNLINQGWTSGSVWTSGTDTAVNPGASLNHTVVLTLYNAGLPIVGGDLIQFVWTNPHFSSITTTYIVQATSYVGTTLTGTLTSYSITGGGDGTTSTGTVATPVSIGFISTWFAAIGNYPSNSDVWWYFKNAAGVFAPATQLATVTTAVGPAPKGHFLLNAFNQDFSTASGVANLTAISTLVRPKTGTWFQGRVWYAGTNASVAATGDARNYTWAENIYFSQTVTIPSDFGKCYQNNDPTSETLFGLLPTDGGVITIQGSGSVYKLFPIQNGMLVFAANGIWFITGSQGIGFAANDYTITKISSVQSISGTSYVDVQGLPYFWNEEGIYQITPSKSGSLEVNPITVGTILSFYNEIPMSSKKYARGAYHPIDYVIQWVYRDTNATDVTGRYTYNKIMNFNTYNKAFFPYTVDTTTSINGITYVAGPGGSTSPDPVFKYFCSTPSAGSYAITFAEERDVNFVDWGSINYESFFVTGFKLHGQGQRRFQIPYIYVFNRTENGSVSYKIQGLWDYASSGISGRWSTAQIVNIFQPYSTMVFRRHKIRGQGLVLQIKVRSVDGEPFDIMGWSTYETMNQGI